MTFIMTMRFSGSEDELRRVYAEVSKVVSVTGISMQETDVYAAQSTDQIPYQTDTNGRILKKCPDCNKEYSSDV